MKVSKKLRLTELENEKARLRDEICDLELAQEAIRKEAAEDSDSCSSIPKRKKTKKTIEQQEVNPSLLDSNDLTMSICDDAIDRHTTMNCDDSLSSYN